jgi:serine/threonine protein phosphatase PrpC
VHWIVLLAFSASLILGALALFRHRPSRRAAGSARAPSPQLERRTPSIAPPLVGAMEEESSWRAGVVLERELEHDETTATFDWFRVQSAARTDPGQKRRQNEDRYLCLPDAALLVVADGMGGEVAGEVASTIAVDEIGAAFSEVASHGPEWPLDVDEKLPKGGQLLVDAICRANDAIRRRTREEPRLRGMGTTIVALHFAARKNRIYVAHVGDSRAYRLRDGVMTLLTTDHTLAGIAGAKGGVGDKLAWALGAAEHMTIDVKAIVPQVGDRFLLCSDGLSKPVGDSEIESVLASETDLERCAERLIDLANERGGPDNVTAVVAEIVTA